MIYTYMYTHTHTHTHTQAHNRAHTHIPSSTAITTLSSMTCRNDQGCCQCQWWLLDIENRRHRSLRSRGVSAASARRSACAGIKHACMTHIYCSRTNCRVRSDC